MTSKDLFSIFLKFYFLMKKHIKLYSLFILHILVFILIKFLFSVYLNELFSRKLIYYRNEEFNLAFEVFEKIDITLFIYTITILISASICYYFIKNKNIIHKKFTPLIYTWISYVLIVSIRCFWSVYYREFEFSNGNLNDDFFVTYLQFIPYLIIIFQNHFSNFNILEDKKTNSQNAMNELETLYSSGILTKEEFELKNLQLQKTIIESEIKLTKEFEALVSLHKKNILSEIEFNNKKEELINEKLNKIKK